MLGVFQRTNILLLMIFSEFTGISSREARAKGATTANPRQARREAQKCFGVRSISTGEWVNMAAG
jgi:hypothetical protein